ncbi:MAG: twin-arginine translocation signal domain-containing protein [Chitinophagaceae bacterium]
MKPVTNRREFIKMTTLSGAAVGLASAFPNLYANSLAGKPVLLTKDPAFIPSRAASWWTTIEDLQWPQKFVVDRIKKRAEGFARAGIDTAINFGFGLRFDFSNYFAQVHGYYANVCEELHKHGIKFMDHYSCNEIVRPRNEGELKKMVEYQRHAVLLYHDPIAAKYAQYEGYFFNDLCEVDLRDGSRGYARQYQFETFCHNNPGFLDMHQKYLRRLLKEVPIDGIEVDDMCNYPGPTTCGCKYCRERFKKEYGHEIPPFGEKSFWGDTSKNFLLWGNYDNPVFRDWLRMKIDSVADHLKMIKATIGEMPLMTCCSNTGPVILNNLSLDLEKLAPHLDFFMLENVGININNADWIEMDAEAVLQKDIAQKKGNAPAMALSYTIYEPAAYFGWSLSRFWGVANWSSTLNRRMPEDPPDAMEMEDVIDKTNNWEKQYSNLNYRDGNDVAEVRLVSNRYCKENGWRNTDGHEHWDSVAAWSIQLLKNNVGYRFVRYAELEDAKMLSSEKTPLILDAVGCVSDKQFTAIKTYLANGGIVWMALPFGTHDEKGFARTTALSEELKKGKHKNLSIITSAVSSQTLQQLIAAKEFKPIIRQTKGDNRWAVRLRMYNNKPVIHFMNTALLPTPHPTIKDTEGVPVITQLNSKIKDNDLAYEIDTARFALGSMSVMSPELETTKRSVTIQAGSKSKANLEVNLDGINVYAVVA